ncbi:MAG: DUF4145 domain-containing protein [Bacteroidetes bacterium]|nr:DUF4145 domain-containing protein [Bacteroidota bacterium]
MSDTISYSYGGRNNSIEAPNKCPLCHSVITVKESISQSVFNNMFQFVFKCPSNKCNNYFIAYYKVEDNNQLNFQYHKPTNILYTKFADVITNLSSNFISIYKEAEEAKQIGLAQIAGPGYRKAFEFLIKDYVKSLIKPEEYKTIESTFAGDVITNYIPDKRIQAVAKRALWLGNDETHYFRKWTDKDINDLITLINLTIHWIEIEKISSDYIEDMPEKAEESKSDSNKLEKQK